MANSSGNFNKQVGLLLRGDLLPTRMETRDGNPIGNPSRVSASVKEKSRVLEGEMGRLSQEVVELKKMKEDLRDVKKQLDFEHGYIGKAEVVLRDLVQMVQNSRQATREHLLQIDSKLEQAEVADAYNHRQ